MKRWRAPVLILLLPLCAARLAVAQMATYDATLEDCLTWTLTHNPEIQQARADVERAAGTKIEYWSRALPQLSAQSPNGLRYGALYSPNGPFSIVTAQFSQPLLDAGIPPTLRRGRLEVILAQQTLNRLVTDRLHDVHVTFLRALYLRDLIALHENIDQRLQANVQAEQQRFDVGAGNEQALKSATIQQLNGHLDLVNLRNDYFAAVTRIAELCGRDMTAGAHDARQLRLPKPVGDLPYEPVTVDWQQESAYALAHRADVKLLEALRDAATADKQTATAGYLPLVSLAASGLFIPQNYLVSRQTDIVPGQDTRTSELRTGVTWSWRMIDNGEVTGARHRLEAIREGYGIALRQLRQNIPRELAVIEGALQNANAQRKALLESVAAAEEGLRLIEAQVAVGTASQFDFLTAQGNLVSVRAGLVEATESHAIARAELDRATGRYLEYRTVDAR